MIEIQAIRATLKGISPLIQHNAQALDPLHPLAKQMKDITGKVKKTDADILSLRRIEWEAGLYLWQQKVVMPTDNILACIAKGASKEKGGKEKVASGVFPFSFSESDGDYWAIEFNGDKKPWEDLYGDSRSPYVFAKRVVIKRSAVFRVRPRIPLPWSLTFTLGTYPSIVRIEEVKKWLTIAGSIGGLCDWRPRYGRFLVESCELIKAKAAG